ncbi:MAG: MG2 domain-containing protein [Candidatus Hodarchaeales archaeon]
MKNKLVSLIILSILLIGIVQVTSARGALEQNKTMFNDQISENSVIPEFEPEIRPIEMLDTPSIASFTPSPISLNNKTPEVDMKTVADEEQRLIIQIDLEKQNVRKGEPLKYVIQATKGFVPAAGERLVVEIIEGEYWGWYHYYYYTVVDYNQRTLSRKIITTDANGLYEGEHTFTKNGRYSIVIRSESDSYYKSRSFNVAEVGIFWRVSREFVRGQPHSSVAYVLNTSDFSPIKDASVSLTGTVYDYDSFYSEELLEDGPLITDETGIVEITFTPPSNLSNNYNFLVNLSVTIGDETSYVLRDLWQGGYYWTIDGYQEFSPYEFIVTTDKPIYSPRETVNTRILLWENDYLKATKKPSQTSFTLKILTPSQHIIYQKDVQTDIYGVATYSFSLDSEVELGTYQIVTQKDEVISTTDIRVDKYEKPAYKVDLTLDKEYVPPGKAVSGVVTATYYFGKPVTQAQIDLSIGDLTTLTGTTDENGVWTFSYKLPKSLEETELYAISINATVTDPVDREVTASSSLQIVDSVYVYSWVNPWFPKADENITVHFGAYQYSSGRYSWWNWQPLADASVKIKLYAVISSTSDYYITTYNSQTGASGNGQYQFTVPLEVLPFTTRFKGVVELDTEDGREGTDTFYFTVDLSKVEAFISSETYSVGETVILDLKLKNILTDTLLAGDVKIRIFDADYELIGEIRSEVPESGKQFSFKLSPYSPTGNYYIHIYVSKTFTYEWGSYTRYRYSESIFFSVGSSQRFILSLDKSKYSISDSMTISGIVEGETNAPVMVQFVKKGILTTLFVPKDNSASFSITKSDISNLAPKVWIYGFVILSNGQIQEQRLFVEIDSTLIVEISSDKDVYEPGETAQVDIQVYDTNHNPVSTVLAVSFIDSSVFGVEPDPETENEHFTDQDYWPSVWTVTSWKNRQSDWWFWWYDDFHDVGFGWGYYRGGLEEVVMYDSANILAMEQTPSIKSGEESVPEAEEGKAVRDNLPENAYWKPIVIVEDGSLSITLDLPDTIGEWTVRVVATTSSGIGVLEKYTFQTFLPFFVEMIKDPYVLQDDVFIIKGVVYNYLGEILDIEVSIETVSGITILGYESQKLRLPSDFLGSIAWACLAEDTGYLNVTISASTMVSNGTTYYDALRKPVEIVPNGIEVEIKESSFVKTDPSFNYERYTDSVQQTEFLELSLGIGSTAISSWERLVGYPYGCTEQTISRLIPDTLVLDYLNQTGQLTNETRDLLEDMITTGLSRLYSQQHPDGGWGWWSRDSSRVYMTSLVLFGLSAVRDIGIYVEPKVIDSAISALVSKQNSFDGSWTPDSWRNIDKVAFTAFALRSLILWSTEYDDVNAAANKAINFIESEWNEEAKQSSYLAGLYLDAIHDSGLGSDLFKLELITYLETSYKDNHWNYDTSSPYWWRALGGDVEITSLALKAMVLHEPASHTQIIKGAVQWILRRQSRYGWGNTADTAAAISSFITISKEGLSNDENTTVTIYLDGVKLNEYALSTSGEPVVYLNMEENITTGINEISFTQNGPGNVSYYFYGKQILRALPKIEVKSEITAGLNTEFRIPIELNRTSSTVFARNLTIDPIEGDINPNPNLPYITQLLTHNARIDFSYTAPSQVGVYFIPGFEISYQLSDSTQTLLSPGLINRRYGPIQLTVVDESDEIFPAFFAHQKSIDPYKVRKIVEESSTPVGIELTRSFSKEKFIKSGELVFVTLEIDNGNDTLNFIMLEDMIPTGFKLDLSTIQHPTEMYEVTSSGITFFFPKLSLGTTKVKYGLVASNIRQSLVTPAELSSMYDDWVVKSAPGVLGESRLPIDPMSGEIQKDLIFPELVSLSLKEISVSFSPYLKIDVVAEDNWGVASVNVFVKQNTWTKLECFSEEGTWSVNALGLHDGAAQIFLEIMDYAGNVIISRESSHMLELDDLLIPIIPITFLLVTALLSGISISFIVRKRGI